MQTNRVFNFSGVVDGEIYTYGGISKGRIGTVVVPAEKFSKATGQWETVTVPKTLEKIYSTIRFSALCSTGDC